MVIGVKLVDDRWNLIEHRAYLNDPLKSLPLGIKIVYFTVDHLPIWERILGLRSTVFISTDTKRSQAGSSREGYIAGG